MSDAVGSVTGYRSLSLVVVVCEAWRGLVFFVRVCFVGWVDGRVRFRFNFMQCILMAWNGVELT